MTVRAPILATHDLIVVGGGPAGASAAIAASRRGLSTVLFDEAAAAGGQVYRPLAEGLRTAATNAEHRAGDRLRAEVTASNIDLRFGRRVWAATTLGSQGPGYRIDAVGPQGAEHSVAPRLIAATGAHERLIPFSGWTLPGVLGLAAATILVKSQAMSPGRRVLVAGCGPLLAAVASKIVAAGCAVAAVVDLASRSDWLRATPRLASRPVLLAEGASWLMKLAVARVPIFHSHTVLRAEGEDAVARVVVGPCAIDGAPSGDAQRTFDVDCLVVGHGLIPGSDIPGLLRSAHRYDRRRGGWVPIRDADGRTTVPGLYAIGDAAGIAGAVPAALAGELAGLAAARDAGAIGATRFERDAQPLRATLSQSLRFADAIAEMMALRPGLVRAIARETVVCRCEDVTRGEIEGAIANGACDINQLKHFTRCGMGPCQGRMCGETAAELLAGHRGSRETVGRWTPRPPLRPIPLADLLGTFNYDDIPVPEPAPL